VKRLSIVSLSLLVLVGSAVGLYAAESETFTGTAAMSGTYKRPQLLVDGIIVYGIMSSAEPLPSTGASTGPDRPRYKSYEYIEAGKTLRLIIPEDLVVVRRPIS